VVGVRRTPSAHAIHQYASTTANLDARAALHAYGTNPQSWFAWLAERLPLDGSVLEVGAGTGVLWTHVDPTELRPTLTDFSAAMCARLGAVPGARVVRCDATRLPFRDASHDTVIANHMMYHLDDPELALRGFARVLRRGGRVAIATNGREHLAELNALAGVIGRADLTLSKYQNGFTAEAGPGSVARHFGDVDVERYVGDLDVPAAEPVVAYLASMAGEPLPPEQAERAHRLVAERVRADGGFRVRKHTVLITAVRA